MAWRQWRLDKEPWRLDEARQHFTRALALGQRMGERYTTSETRWSLANIAIAVKQPGAGPELRDALAELWTIRAWSFWMGAELAALELLNWDRTEATAMVLGYLEARGIRHGVRPERRRQALDRLAHLPESAAWMRQGAELERDQIVSYLFAALEDLGATESA